jgi:PEP-CTERM motif
MKKILLTLIGMVAGASLVHAQGGLLSWQAATGHPLTNTSTYATGYPTTTGHVSGFTGGSAAGLYYFVLLAATSTTSNDNGNPFGTDWSAVTYAGGGIALGTNNVVAGSITGNGGSAGFASSLTAGTTYFDMVVSWSASLGADWATASSWGPSFGSSPAGYFGYSNVGTIVPAAAPANGAGIFAGASAQPGQTVLYAVPTPEPTTIALAGLGGLAALALRRRKA